MKRSALKKEELVPEGKKLLSECQRDTGVDSWLWEVNKFSLLYITGQAGLELPSPQDQRGPNGEGRQLPIPWWFMHHRGLIMALSCWNLGDESTSVSLPPQTPRGLPAASQGVKDFLNLHHREQPGRQHPRLAQKQHQEGQQNAPSEVTYQHCKMFTPGSAGGGLRGSLNASILWVLSLLTYLLCNSINMSSPSLERTHYRPHRFCKVYWQRYTEWENNVFSGSMLNLTQFFIW